MKQLLCWLLSVGKYLMQLNANKTEMMVKIAQIPKYQKVLDLCSIK